MPQFKVIKAHDGIEEGTIKSLSSSSVTRYMVENGYWEEISEKAEKPVTRRATTRTKSVK